MDFKIRQQLRFWGLKESVFDIPPPRIDKENGFGILSFCQLHGSRICTDRTSVLIVRSAVLKGSSLYRHEYIISDFKRGWDRGREEESRDSGDEPGRRVV